MIRLAVLLSGRGTNMAALAERCSKDPRFSVAFVASSRADAPGLAKARQFGLQTAVLPYREGKEAAEGELTRLICDSDVSLIVLAGFMRILSPQFVAAHRGRIVNIHPALLPAFPGAHAIDDFWATGEKYSGVTVHLVDELTDHGPILVQETVTREDGDTRESYEEKIHAVEHRIYWPAVRDYALSLPGAGKGDLNEKTSSAFCQR
ncbi:phosphoribosylglycinamide formyltransferase [Jonquetella anthropi]|uniref:phosphoribosylglycinamide formyltransferase n=1 Tax=Jonquetella anthropi TaxID=428712 RepID=UPI0001B91198|nr:phosphoribosylglycinamide formyltransferase [Jonquetella anthropi]EEX48229.1 phosphoribosylglycinamide formyltransferase [Jonquetella anthropi E3_33 E1]